MILEVVLTFFGLSNMEYCYDGDQLPQSLFNENPFSAASSDYYQYHLAHP